jgi:hypothetical protein
MVWWIYKCNNKNHAYQSAYGDWEEFFGRESVSRWGSTEYSRKLANELLKLTPGDRIIAYQTDRNELVGICEFVRFKNDGSYKIVLLRPLQRIGVKVRPLKEGFREVAAIPALQGGPIKTLYLISPSEARLLLRAARASAFLGDQETEESFLEGERRATFSTVRSAQLRAAAKRRWGLTCYCCGFDFEEFYGLAGRGMAIVHHLSDFAGLNGQRRRATVDDVRVVCANCHYLIHREMPPISVEALKASVAKSWSGWTPRGNRRLP